MSSIDSDNSGESIEGFDDIEPEITACLFCENTTHSVDDAIIHLRVHHNVDMRKLKAKFHMDQYSYIKLINYIRCHSIDAETLVNMQEPLWYEEKYLKPIRHEPWLTYDFEGLESGPTDPNSSYDDLTMRNVIQQLKQKLREKDELLEQATKDIEKLRLEYKKLFEKDLNCKLDDQQQIQDCISNVPLDIDEGYFSSYAHFSIHHDMLSDSVRTSSYRDSFLNNKEFFRGKTVLDVGCGTSILSMFASQAGADKIVAVDNSDIIYNAIDIARKNNFTNIEFVKGRLEDTRLPLDSFDVIVSEWMGYFLIFEGMLDTIIHARELHLKPDGVIIPNRCNISLMGYGDENRYKELITFWDSVYGFDMTSMKKEVLQEPLIEICKSECVLTEPNVIANYDLYTVDLNYSNFSYDFNLKVIKEGHLASFIGFFDTFFDLPNSLAFSTSPHQKPTHWKQVVFFIDNPVQVKLNEVITGKIICQRNPKDMRSLKIKLKVFNKEYCYKLN